MQFSKSRSKEDARLLSKIGRGDLASFELFYDRYSEVVYSVAFRILNDVALAEAVTQQVFVKIWTKAPIYDPSRSAAATWAIMLARTYALARLPEGGAPEVSDFVKESPNASETRVRTTLNELPEAKRQALHLALFSGLNEAAISEKTGAPPGVFTERIRRTMMRLREAII